MCEILFSHECVANIFITHILNTLPRAINLEAKVKQSISNNNKTAPNRAQLFINAIFSPKTREKLIENESFECIQWNFQTKHVNHIFQVPSTLASEHDIGKNSMIYMWFFFSICARGSNHAIRRKRTENLFRFSNQIIIHFFSSSSSFWFVRLIDWIRLRITLEIDRLTRNVVYAEIYIHKIGKMNSN